MRRALALLAVLVLALAAVEWLRARRETAAPAPGSAVRDAAGLLTPEQRGLVERHHRLLLLDHDIDYRVETTRDVGDLDRFAARRFQELDVGSKSGAGRGLLLVVDAGQDLARLEVGRELEGVYTDAFVAYVERNQLVPFFRASRVADGILATTELVVVWAKEVVARPYAPAFAGAG